jgi:hypothetical protein
MIFTYKERLKGFCDKYRIKILDDNRRTPVLAANEYFVDPNDKNIATTVQVVDTEPLVTLEIPLSKLKLMSDIEATFFNNEYDRGHRNLFENIMDMMEEEKILREQYPAVANAYSSYSTLLHLCKKQPK